MSRPSSGPRWADGDSRSRDRGPAPRDDASSQDYRSSRPSRPAGARRPGSGYQSDSASRGPSSYRSREGSPGGREESGRQDDTGGRRPYADRSGSSDRRPYSDRGDRGGSSDRRPYANRGDRGGSSDRQGSGERRPYGDRSDRAGFSDRRDSSERRPYGERSDRGGTSDRRPYGDRTDRGSSGERRPYAERSDRSGSSDRRGSTERRPYSDRSGSGERRPYSDRSGSSERRPYAERSDRGGSSDRRGPGERSDRRDFGDRRESGSRDEFRSRGPARDRGSRPGTGGAADRRTGSYSRDGGRDQGSRPYRDSSRPGGPTGDRSRESAPGGRRPWNDRDESQARPPREPGPRIPESVSADQLDADAKAQLNSLPNDLADTVARYLVAAGVAENPEEGYAFAQAAKRLAARVGVVREACGIAAYQTGRWADALSEFRAARRMTGRDDYVPIMADCERALGRPDRALALVREVNAADLSRPTQIELRIVESGIRRDQGLADAAVLVLQVPELTSGRVRPWSARLFYAYGDALLAADRAEEARAAFARAVELDPDGETDAAERLDELDGIVIDDLEDDEFQGDLEDDDDLDDGESEDSELDSELEDGEPDDAELEDDPQDDDPEDDAVEGQVKDEAEVAAPEDESEQAESEDEPQDKQDSALEKN